MYHPFICVHITYTLMLLHILICSTTHISTSYPWIEHIPYEKVLYHDTVMVSPQKPHLPIHTQSFLFFNSFWLTRPQSCEILKSERVWESSLQGSNMWRLRTTWCSVLTGNLWGSVSFVDRWQPCIRLKLLIMSICIYLHFCIYVWVTAIYLV